MPTYSTEPLYAIRNITPIDFSSMDVICGNLANSSSASNVSAKSTTYFN